MFTRKKLNSSATSNFMHWFYDSNNLSLYYKMLNIKLNYNNSIFWNGFIFKLFMLQINRTDFSKYTVWVKNVYNKKWLSVSWKEYKIFCISVYAYY